MSGVYAGCDVGVVTAKVAVVDDDGRLCSGVVVYGSRPKPVIDELLDRVLASRGLGREDVACCLAAGIGKEIVGFADGGAPDSLCLMRAAREWRPGIRTFLDVGGHSFSAFSVDDRGRIGEATISDKCATGLGLYLELIARALATPLEELVRGSLGCEHPAPISSQCAILAESEAISRLNEGADRHAVFAGVARAMAHRIRGLISQVGLLGEVALTGGVGKNTKVARELELLLGVPLADLGIDPQVVAACGAALLARDRAAGSPPHGEPGHRAARLRSGGGRR